MIVRLKVNSIQSRLCLIYPGFNSMIVRLKVIDGVNVVVTFQEFQFYDSAIKRYLDSITFIRFRSFNSTIVRLKGSWFWSNSIDVMGFNSTIVRLKGIKSNSSIKSDTRFNSTIVRLKGDLDKLPLFFAERFQFYDSAIKRSTSP